MIFHKEMSDSLEPCKHMEPLLNRTAEGSASKLGAWYAHAHAHRCPRCGPFLTRLSALLFQLKSINSDRSPVVEESLSVDRWENIESQWTEAEAT